MVNENIIPKTETVYELKNEVPSFEEFMKNYNENKETVDSYENEFESYEDMRVKGTYYGPGFWDTVWKGTKKVGGFALAVSYATPIAPITMTATVVAVGSAAVMKEYGNEEWKSVANEIVDVVVVAGDMQDAGGEAARLGNNIRAVTRR